MIFDPLVLFHLALEYLLQIAYALAEEIFSFGHNADAEHVVMLRDVPEPALFRHVCDGRRALVLALVAFGAFEISPDRNFVQQWITHAPVVARRAERLASRAIDGDLRPVFARHAFAVGRTRAHNLAVLANQI